jgi:uncharacterized membrane protein
MYQQELGHNMPRLVGAAQTTASQAEQITTFNSSGTLTTQPQTGVVQYVIVAGGGAGVVVLAEAEVQADIVAQFLEKTLAVELVQNL